MMSIDISGLLQMLQHIIDIHHKHPVILKLFFILNFFTFFITNFLFLEISTKRSKEVKAETKKLQGNILRMNERKK